MPGSDKPGAAQVTFIAVADLNRFRCVDLDSTGQVKYTDEAGRFVGVTMGPAKAGGAASVLLPQGIALIEAGGTIAAGASVGSDATGRVVTGNGVGVATEAAAAAGQIISVVLGISEPATE